MFLHLSLIGGLSGFRQNHDDLCEHSLHLEEGQDGSTAMGLSGALPHSLPSTPDIENAELTAILPFLYLGNERDAQDLEQMQRMDIGFILNVTTHLPLYHYDLGLFKYKRLPATDSNKQNLRQYFEEAFEFIGMTSNMIWSKGWWESNETVKNMFCSYFSPKIKRKKRNYILVKQNEGYFYD